MNKTELKKLMERWDERCRMIQESTIEFIDTEEKDRRIAKARKNYRFFVETYFPHLATSKCGAFQIDAANKIKDNRNLRALFEWARGHAKSSHISLLIPIWLLIQEKREINIMVLVSKSEDMAIRLLSDIQAELEYNKHLISDFGEFKGNGDWSDGEFRCKDGRKFFALGRGQSPRGLKSEGNRPDYIVIDDIDDDEIVLNDSRVKKAVRWLFSALLGTMAMGRGRFVMVGNRISKTGILAKFAERPNIYHTIVNALDKNGKPTWKENYTEAEIAELREFAGERNFQQEYMNNPITEGSIFKEKYIRYGKILPLRKYRTLVCYTDPSFKNSTKNDYKATVLIGKTAKGEIHILRAFCDQASVSNMVEWHYDIRDWINGETPVMFYMESNFIQDTLLDEFKKEGEERGDHIPIRGDSRKKPDKFARIEAMQPIFERGLIVFNEDEKDSMGMINLVQQLLLFERGSSVHDDGPDALEGAVWMINRRTMTGSCKYAYQNRKSQKW